MITLNELLDEISQIVNANKKRAIENSESQKNKEKYMPESKIPFKKKFRFDLLNNLEVSNNTVFGNIIKDYISPFSSSIKRYGTIKSFGDSKINISFYSSMINIFFSKYSSEETARYDLSTNASQLSAIDELINYVISVVEYLDFKKDSFISKTYGWKKKELIHTLKSKECDKTILGLFSYIFDLNIFLFHIANDNILSIYPEEKFNKFKNSIVLSFYDDTYEPISFKDSFIWSYDINNNNHNLFVKLVTINYNSFASLNIGLIDNKIKNFKLAQYEELY